MCGITCFLALLAIGVTIIIGICTYCRGHEPLTSFRAGFITFLVFTIAYLTLPLFFWDQIWSSIPQSTIDQITVLSLIFAIITIATNNIKEIKTNNPSTPLNSKIVTTETKITPQVDNSTQEIVERFGQIATLLEQMNAMQPDQSQVIVMQLNRIAVALKQMITRFDLNQEIIKQLGLIERCLKDRLPEPEPTQPPDDDDPADHPDEE